MKKYVINDGRAYDYEEMVSIMDFELCEILHNELAPCTEQEFADEYARRFDANLTAEELEEFGGWYDQCANLMVTKNLDEIL